MVCNILHYNWESAFTCAIETTRGKSSTSTSLSMKRDTKQCVWWYMYIYSPAASLSPVYGQHMRQSGKIKARGKKKKWK